MNKLQAFLAKYSITTHSVAAVITALIGAYYTSPQFHDFVMATYNKLPKDDKDIVATIVALVALYYRSTKSQENK
jgi:hypothetical protein